MIRNRLLRLVNINRKPLSRQYFLYFFLFFAENFYISVVTVDQEPVNQIDDSQIKTEPQKSQLYAVVND